MMEGTSLSAVLPHRVLPEVKLDNVTGDVNISFVFVGNPPKQIKTKYISNEVRRSKRKDGKSHR